MKPILNFKDMYLINSSRFKTGVEFVQFGKYNEAEFDDLVFNQNYIPIATIDELSSLRTTTSQTMGFGTKYEGNYNTGLDKKYVVYTNLNFTSYSFTRFTNIFTGTFDGNQVSFTNMSSMIFLTNSGTIKDCNYSGSITVSGTYSGGFVTQNTGIIDNCNWSGSLIVDDYSGGICGTNSNVVSNCSASGTINGVSYIGGICGSNLGTMSNCSSTMNVTGTSSNVSGVSANNGGTISYCSSSGIINGVGYVGGIVGRSDLNSYIEYCYTSCEVNGTNERIGGFIGHNVGVINECYATGDVSNTATIGNGFSTGGFVGANYAATAVINNCWCSGNVVSSGQYVGGFGGFCPDAVTNSYSLGTVAGLSPIGGFCGSGSSVTNSYWDTVTSGWATSSGGIGKTTTEMQNGSIPDTTIYVGWSNLIWDAVNNTSYPILINTP